MAVITAAPAAATADKLFDETRPSSQGGQRGGGGTSHTHTESC